MRYPTILSQHSEKECRLLLTKYVFVGQVVRVGSRIQSEDLKKYSLNNLRWSMRRQSSRRGDANQDFNEINLLRLQGTKNMEQMEKEMQNFGG